MAEKASKQVEGGLSEEEAKSKIYNTINLSALLRMLVAIVVV